jgi:hypothetical protein
MDNGLLSDSIINLHPGKSIGDILPVSYAISHYRTADSLLAATAVLSPTPIPGRAVLTIELWSQASTSIRTSPHAAFADECAELST